MKQEQRNTVERISALLWVLLRFVHTNVTDIWLVERVGPSRKRRNRSKVLHISQMHWNVLFGLYGVFLTVYTAFGSIQVNQISVTSVCTNRSEFTAVRQILKKVFSILLHRQEHDLAQIRINQHRRCQYRGYSCRTALDELSKRCTKLPQGSLSPYIMYAGFCNRTFDDVTWNPSQIDRNRKTNSGSGNRPFWTAFFTHKTTAKNYQKNWQALHYQ